MNDFRRSSHAIRTLAFGGLLGSLVAGCTIEQTGNGAGGNAASGQRTQIIKVDGSSTVAPISMAIAEVFEEQHPGARLKVNVSGTGGGFEAFGRGDIDISNASRPMKPSESAAAEANGTAYFEFTVAIDGLTIVVHPQNDWCNALTVEQLGAMWKKGSPVQKWSDVDPAWPKEPIKLFGADSKSGTYDYFKEETVGKDNPMRTDYQPNTDDNVLVTGVVGDKYALAFFGYAYYVENSQKLKAVAIAGHGRSASEAVLPTQETIRDGSYSPLSRPLYIYVNRQSLQRPEVREFAKFHLSDEGQRLVGLKQYIPLSPEQLEASRKSFDAAMATIEK